MPEMTADPIVDEAAHHAEHRHELRLETSTMALYVSVVLLAALVEGRCWHALDDTHLTYVLVKMTSPVLRVSM